MNHPAKFRLGASLPCQHETVDRVEPQYLLQFSTSWIKFKSKDLSGQLRSGKTGQGGINAKSHPKKLQ